MRPVLELRGVARRYGSIRAVNGVTLTLGAGRITCLLGPSGCGKSTLLRLIAGLEPADDGEIHLGGRVLSAPAVHVKAEARDIGLVFQDYALFPHLTVRENVAFGLQSLAPPERTARVEAELARVRLDHRATAHPRSLSGGERQRVALARALAREPSVLLLDEPFSGLDGPLKADVRDAALAALRAAGSTVLIVTHDAEEAMLMADDLALMHRGAIVQTGSPRDCYLKPVSLLAAGLLGDLNALPARVAGGMAVTAFGAVAADHDGDVVMARPEALMLVDEGAPALVVESRFAGDHMALILEAGGVRARARAPLDQAPAVNQTVQVALDPDGCRLFSPESPSSSPA
ncbi:MAG: ATP-binding cassette domain-containing protein [Caulobacter sp.]|nr:ATP-binding cassette domain-containing protein [Caulobacter sp.]